MQSNAILDISSHPKRSVYYFPASPLTGVDCHSDWPVPDLIMEEPRCAADL